MSTPATGLAVVVLRWPYGMDALISESFKLEPIVHSAARCAGEQWEQHLFNSVLHAMVLGGPVLSWPTFNGCLEDKNKVGCAGWLVGCLRLGWLVGLQVDGWSTG